MKKICGILEKEKGLDLSGMKALELFARDGSWQTTAYADKVAALDAWEIDPSFERSLKKNLPKANIKITDSIRELVRKSNHGKYDLVVVDNGQGCFGADRTYCEHFDVIPEIAKFLDTAGIVIFNINKKPFNYDQSPDWRRRRQEYYHRNQTARISIHWLLSFYKELFSKSGYSTRFCFSVSREDLEHDDYLHYLVYYLQAK